MNTLSKKTLTALAVLAAAASPLANVQAATCDPQGKSSFTLEASEGSTGVISCYKTEGKNIHFQNDDVVVSEPGGPNSVLFADVIDLTDSVFGLKDKGDGTFEIEASVWDYWDSIYIGLKQGKGYGLFLLTESIFSGTWKTAPGKGNGLSHYLAFGGDAATPDTPDVPVPAALWLFGSGLAGLIGAVCRKSATA